VISDKQQVQEWISAYGTPQQVALRCRIVLAAASGQSDNAIAQQLAINRKTVMLWRGRFVQQGLPSLWEVAPGRGRKATYGAEKIQQIIDTTLQSKPRGGTQWSCRSLAKRLGVSKSTVSAAPKNWSTLAAECRPVGWLRSVMAVEEYGPGCCFYYAGCSPCLEPCARYDLP
jgi:transposase